jgi:hypothetical protein
MSQEEFERVDIVIVQHKLTKLFAVQLVYADGQTFISKKHFKTRDAAKNYGLRYALKNSPEGTLH